MMGGRLTITCLCDMVSMETAVLVTDDITIGNTARNTAVLFQETSQLVVYWSLLYSSSTESL